MTQRPRFNQFIDARISRDLRLRQDSAIILMQSKMKKLLFYFYLLAKRFPFAVNTYHINFSRKRFDIKIRLSALLGENLSYSPMSFQHLNYPIVNITSLVFRYTNIAPYDLSSQYPCLIRNFSKTTISTLAQKIANVRGRREFFKPSPFLCSLKHKTSKSCNAESRAPA